MFAWRQGCKEILRNKTVKNELTIWECSIADKGKEMEQSTSID